MKPSGLTVPRWLLSFRACEHRGQVLGSENWTQRLSSADLQQKHGPVLHADFPIESRPSCSDT